MLKKYQLRQAIDDVKGTAAASAFTVNYGYSVYNDDGTHSTVTTSIQSADVLAILERKWSTWSIVYNDPVTTPLYILFVQMFGVWKTRNLYNLGHMMSAYSAQYNPLNNYQGREQHSRLANAGYIDDSTSHIYAQYTDSTTDGSTDSVTTFDSDDLNVTGNTADGGSVTHGAHTDTDSKTITHHNALNGNADYSGGSDLFGNSVTGGDAYENEITSRFGNLGVTSSQKMITEELELRQHDIIEDWLSDFVMRYCILSPDVAEGESEWD